MKCGQLGCIFQVKVDRFVAQFVDKIGLPIPLKTGNVETVEHALQHRKRHRREKLKGWPPEIAQWLEKLVCLFRRTVVTPNDQAHLFEMQSLRKRGPGRDRVKSEEAADLLRRANDKFPIPLHDLHCIFQLPEHWASANHLNGMCLELKRSDNPEISAASTNRPE